MEDYCSSEKAGLNPSKSYHIEVRPPDQQPGQLRPNHRRLVLITELMFVLFTEYTLFLPSYYSTTMATIIKRLSPRQ